MSRKKGKRKKKTLYKQESSGSKLYFGQEHEDAIVQYARSTDPRERNDIYINTIEPVLVELVDKIVYTYKFTVLPNIDSLKADAVVFLVTILNKFDPDKGYKAFSYFSVVTKNWFTHQCKNNSKKKKREISFEEHQEELEEKLIDHKNYEQMRRDQEFWQEFYKDMNRWSEYDDGFTETDEIVLEAIITLFNNADSLQLFSKKASYLYLRELTNLDTKKIVPSLKKFKKYYLEFINDWSAGDI